MSSLKYHQNYDIIKHLSYQNIHFEQLRTVGKLYSPRKSSVQFLVSGVIKLNPKLT